MQELPFYNANNLIQEFSSYNSNSSYLPAMKQLNKYPSMCDLGLFNLNAATDVNMDITQQSIRTQCYSPYKFAEVANKNPQTKNFSMLHNNVRSLKRNLENLQIHLLRELDYNFYYIHFEISGVSCNPIG